MAPKFFVETLGCQMNYHDSERIVGLLERDGLEAATGESDADVIVGTQRIAHLPALVNGARERRRAVVDIRPFDDVSVPMGIARHSDPVRRRRRAGVGAATESR